MRSGMVLSVLLFLLALTAVGTDAANAQVVPVVSIPSSFSNTGDANIQQQELGSFVEGRNLSSRVVQTDLALYPKISQYTDINSSDTGYGPNACGLVAAAAAMGGKDWVPLVGMIADAAGTDYGKDKGIQPTKYVAALQKVFGTENVSAMNDGTLGALYQALAAGKIVIVDLKVNATRLLPSADPPNYSHYARVLGIDVARQEIYLQNTLEGSPYWTLATGEFVAAWIRPETSASTVPDPGNAEPVTRWAVILNPASL